MELSETIYRTTRITFLVRLFFIHDCLGMQFKNWYIDRKILCAHSDLYHSKCFTGIDKSVLPHANIE